MIGSFFVTSRVARMRVALSTRLPLENLTVHNHQKLTTQEDSCLRNSRKNNDVIFIKRFAYGSTFWAVCSAGILASFNRDIFLVPGRENEVFIAVQSLDFPRRSPV